MYYLLAIIGALITSLAQAYISATYSKYSKVKSSTNMNGKEAAEIILKNNELNLKINKVTGYLSDHYDPSSKTVNLSESIYEDATIASVAVSAHECGHAIQDKVKYFFLRLRAAFVPIVNFCSYAGYLAIVVGCALSSSNIIWLGILLEVGILLFQLITLPVEINASKRALKQIKTYNILSQSELKQAKSMLIAAALTYVASVATALIQILRLVLVYGNKNNK